MRESISDERMVIAASIILSFKSVEFPMLLDDDSLIPLYGIARQIISNHRE